MALRMALKHACAVILPPDAKQEALDFIDGVDNGISDRMRIPSTATLSRCRARLDVAWTLLFRNWLSGHLRAKGGSGVSLYIQTDATWQARQEYQVTLLNIVHKDCLLDLHKDRAVVTCFLWFESVHVQSSAAVLQPNAP